MSNPYENIVIGNFLYGLGRAMGKHPRGVDGCVNLLQQTPLDPALGDVMLQFPAVWRLIEFKRDGGKMEKENSKYRLVVAATEKNDSLRAASRRGHWFVLADRWDAATRAGQRVSIRVCPYLDMHGSEGIPLEQFAQEIVEEACSGGTLTDEELDLYLTLMGLFGSVKRADTSGLLVGVSGSGGLTYIPVPDIADLRGTAGLLRERMLAASLQQEAQPQISHSDRVRDAISERALEVQRPSHERQITMGM